MKMNGCFRCKRLAIIPLDYAALHAPDRSTTFQPRRLSHPSRFLVLSRATDSPVFAAPTPDYLGSTHWIALIQESDAVRVSEDGAQMRGVPDCLSCFVDRPKS